MKAVDEQPVWSVICFVVPAEYRGQGVAQALLRGAVAYAKEQGATLVEAYPVDKPTRSNDDYMWFGAKSMYRQRRLQGSGASQAPAAHRPHQACLSRQFRRRLTTRYIGRPSRALPGGSLVRYAPMSASFRRHQTCRGPDSH